MKRKMTLGKKISMGFGIIIVIVLINQLSSYSLLREYHHDIKKYSSIVNEMGLGKDIKEQASHLSDLITDATLMMDKNEMDVEVVNTLKRAKYLIEQLKELNKDDKDHYSRLNEIKTNFDEVYKLGKDLFNARVSNNNFEKAMSKFDAKTTEIFGDISKISEEDSLSTANMRDEMENMANAGEIKLIWFSLITLLLSITIGYFMTNKIKKPVLYLVDKIHEYEKTGENIDINVNTNDEIAELGNALQKMIEKIAMQIGYLDKLPTPIHIRDKEHNIIYINEFGAELAGLTQKEALGKKCYDLFKTEHCQSDKCVVDCAMKSGEIVTSETVSKVTGENKFVTHTGSSVVNKAGEIVAGLEYYSDIDELKNNENYLERNTVKLLEAMDRFASGDLTVFVNAEKTDDDLGKLIAGFNMAVTKIKEMILEVSNAIEATASASTQISSSAEEMAAGAQEQSAQTGEVSAAVEQMAATIIEATQNATQAAEFAKQSGDTAKQGGNVVNQTIVGMENIANVVSEGAEVVEELGISSNKIGEIIQVIDEIADQTNLLALNAAIEAARAGEQGRGFAVVADEVRKLAERTTAATKEIADMIKQIQTQTEHAVDSMRIGKEQTMNGKELVQKAGTSLEEIMSGTDQVMNVVEQVAAASEEQSATVEQITKNIEGVNMVAQESAAAVEQIAKASEDLNRLTENLELLVNQFKIIDGNEHLSNYGINGNGNLHRNLLSN